MPSYFWKKYTLDFKRPGGTSRGVLHTKDSWFLIGEDNTFSYPAIGECSIIKGLSPDNTDQIEEKLDELCLALNQDAGLPDLTDFPAIRFGLETLQADIQAKGSKQFTSSGFVSNQSSIQINGLVWMGEESFMKQQVVDLVERGFSCIKLKIGALDFQVELDLLNWIRHSFDSSLELRVDANGAFTPSEAMHKLEQLAKFDIHSIEQPIKAGQWEEMAKLCASTPLPIALDEELIGVTPENRKELLETIRPQYIILKPSLLGGLKDSDSWIQLARDNGIEWWVTSALESNVGLNHIAQYTHDKKVSLPQGLGTGSLYTNNFDCPLYIQGQFLGFNPESLWNLNGLLNE